MTQPLVGLRIDFYDDPANPTRDTYRGSAKKESVRFALPPRVGDKLAPFAFGAYAKELYPVVTDVVHEPSLGDREEDTPWAEVRVAVSPLESLIEHLEQNGWWMSMQPRE